MTEDNHSPHSDRSPLLTPDILNSKSTCDLKSTFHSKGPCFYIPPTWPRLCLSAPGPPHCRAHSLCEKFPRRARHNKLLCQTLQHLIQRVHIWPLTLHTTTLKMSVFLKCQWQRGGGPGLIHCPPSWARTSPGPQTLIITHYVICRSFGPKITQPTVFSLTWHRCKYLLVSKQLYGIQWD